MAVSYRSATGLPGSYRIALALSIAILLHTLILSGLPFPQQESQEPHHRLTVELLGPGSTEAPAIRPAVETEPRPRQEPGNRNPRFEIPDAEPATTPAPQPVTSVSSPKPAPEPAREKNPSSSETATREPVESAAHTSKPASVAGQPGEPIQTRKEAEKAELARITRSPTQQDPYLIRLAVHLAQELEQLRVPAIARLTDTASMEIELQLMKNGALTRARVMKSTGIKNVDEAAYRAALAASPYPEPPAESESGDRFEVELVFSPKRL